MQVQIWYWYLLLFLSDSAYPALLPIGSGLLSSAVSALPAGCGVIVYYFIRFLKVQHKLLENPDVLMTDKLKLLADGVVQNWGMWITVVAFVAVILLVNLILYPFF